MVDIDEFVKRVVTVDTPQRIWASKNFTGNLEFKGQLNSTTVNGLNLRDYVDRVVFKNRDEVVRGKKTIKGSVNIEGNLNIDGYLNDVDIPKLKGKAMSKSKPNDITAPMAFVNSVEIGK
ncbi:uncharacterized protein LOC111086841 isoform X2 [Limulus polyphemus]|uniref:Uncharacterized protein LOC111086841 isoform X2 n=1 Tax=Limulus polyphemus TaxID=6850 RepID=A0ABM1STV8_LIMPO|nr:uncharacterized protein LOC111086841 isoform X2 [Limulus polyphemus]